MVVGIIGCGILVELTLSIVRFETRKGLRGWRGLMNRLLMCVLPEADSSPVLAIVNQAKRDGEGEL